MTGVVRSLLKIVLVTGMLTGLAACSGQGTATSSGEIFDPYEDTNRQNHAFNRAFDKAVFRPAGVGYSKVLPDDIETSVGNFADNLALPSAVVNNLLQANIKSAFRNSARFLINSTLGFAGLFDPAGDFGVEEELGDFGQTLHVWGVPEGGYVELPFLGPSTERDAVGRVVDLFTNPLSYVLPKPERYYGTAASGGSILGNRGRYAEAIDAMLYDSADSYAQARQFYLNSRHKDLGIQDASSEIDPYALDTEGF